MNIYYVYIYWNPITKEPFYIGYGHNNRRFDHLKAARKCLNPVQGELKLNIIRQLLRQNLEPTISIVGSCLSKIEAAVMEIFLIEMIGRRDLHTGPLANLTDGGDGTRGWSAEAKDVCRKRNFDLGIVPPSQKGRTFTRKQEEKNIPAIIKSSGQRTTVYLSDPRWKTGEVVGINKNVIQDELWRKKNSMAVSKLKWWNNGNNSVRSILLPGPDYVRGRGKVKW